MTAAARHAGEFAIRASGLTKRFRIHSLGATSLKEMVIKGMFTSVETREITAIDDVSFELRRGRTTAIVGGNGSGKSTLLKLITGISQPDSGTIEVNGRVSALLEVGAGFHGDLTGMENIFLQGGILGMSRAGILERLDAILEFSELGDFIHTPLKRYSSGMVVRLGFALSVLSDAEIMLFDEVLAVGDGAFQAKCLRRIDELRREGRTILFVSHAIEHVEAAAEDLIFLDRGRLRAFGPLDDAIRVYQKSFSTGEPVEVQADLTKEERVDRMILLYSSNVAGVRIKTRGALIDRVRFLDEDGRQAATFAAAGSMTVEIAFHTLEPLDAVDACIGFGGVGDLSVAFATTGLDNCMLRDLDGAYVVRARMPRIEFMPARYRFSVGLRNPARAWDYYDLYVEAFYVQVRGDGSLALDRTVLDPPGTFVAVPVETT